MINHQDYVNELIADWDEVYKKGQLTLWVLFALFDGEKYAQEISDFISLHTDHHLSVQEQSLYRALRRFKSLNIVDLVKKPSPDSGPERKYYHLTNDGVYALKRFTELNITPLYAPTIQALLHDLKEKK